MCAQSEEQWRLRWTGEPGFTLLEVMVAVGIIAVVAALASPNFTSWQARSVLKQHTMELNSNLGLAKMTAMNRNTTVTVSLAIVNGRVTVTFTDTTGATVLPQQVMPTEITGLGGPPTIQFNSLGLRVGGGAATQTVTLTNSKGVTFQIQVTPAGKTRWCPAGGCPI